MTDSLRIPRPLALDGPCPPAVVERGAVCLTEPIECESVDCAADDFENDAPPAGWIARGGGYWASRADHEAALAECQALAELLLAPELQAAAAAVYVIEHFDFPSRFGQGVFGYTQSDLDLAAKDMLIRQGRWCGRGPAFVLNGFRLGMRRGNSFADLTRSYRSCAVHELAHIIAAVSLDRCVVPTEPADLKASVANLTRQLRENYQPPPVRSRSLPTFEGHDIFFLRSVCHLAFRAAESGLPVDLEDVIDGPQYGLSPIAMYSEAIGQEPEELLFAPISFVAKLNQPDAFVALYREDMRRATTRHNSKGILNVKTRVEALGTPSPSTVDPLDSIGAAMSKLDAERWTKFERLVIVLADDEPNDPNEGAALLDAMRLSRDYLAERKKTLLDRRQWHAALLAGATAEAEIIQTREDLQAENRRFEPLAVDHRIRVQEILFRQQGAVSRHGDAASARDALVRTCPYPDRVAESVRVSKELRKAQDEGEALNRQLNDARHEASGMRQQAASFDARGLRENLKEATEMAVRFEQKCTDIEVGIAALKTRIDELTRAELKAIEALLQP